MSSKIFRRSLAAAATITAAATMAACAGPSAGPQAAGVSAGEYTGPTVTVDFWNGWTGGAAPTLVPKLIEQFNSEHKNIVVKNVPMEWADISSKMPLAIKAGKGPDVAVAHGDDIATYAAQGLLLKSDEIVKSLGYDAASFPEGLLTAGNYKGSQYGIPWSVTPLGFFINKDVLRAAGLDPENVPTDKDSYMKVLAELKAAGVAGEWVDGYFFSGVMEFKSLLWQFGGDPYNADVTKATFNSEAGVKALTHMTDLVKEGYSPANVAQDGNINALVSGKTAFHWNGIWQTTNEALAKTDWTAAPAPQIGTEKAVWSSSTHWTFANNKNQDTNETAAAATFVKWMNDHSKDWASTGELPAQNTVRNDPSLLTAYPKLKPFLDELPSAHYETSAPGITAVEALIITAVNEAVLGKKSPKDALDDAATQADKLLAQNKSQYGG